MSKLQELIDRLCPDGGYLWERKLLTLPEWSYLRERKVLTLLRRESRPRGRTQT